MDRPNLPGPENENTRPSADLHGSRARKIRRGPRVLVLGAWEIRAIHLTHFHLATASATIFRYSSASRKASSRSLERRSVVRFPQVGKYVVGDRVPVVVDADEDTAPASAPLAPLFGSYDAV